MDPVWPEGEPAGDAEPVGQAAAPTFPWLPVLLASTLCGLLASVRWATEAAADEAAYAAEVVGALIGGASVVLAVAGLSWLAKRRGLTISLAFAVVALSVIGSRLQSAEHARAMQRYTRRIVDMAEAIDGRWDRFSDAGGCDPATLIRSGAAVQRIVMLDRLRGDIATVVRELETGASLKRSIDDDRDAEAAWANVKEQGLVRQRARGIPSPAAAGRRLTRVRHGPARSPRQMECRRRRHCAVRLRRAR